MVQKFPGVENAITGFQGLQNAQKFQKPSEFQRFYHFCRISRGCSRIRLCLYDFLIVFILLVLRLRN